MKKLLTTTAIALSLSCAAQDTTYYQRHNDLYRNVRTHITDNILYQQHYKPKTAKRRRNDTIFTIVVGALFAGLTTWFWVK